MKKSSIIFLFLLGFIWCLTSPLFAGGSREKDKEPQNKEEETVQNVEDPQEPEQPQTPKEPEEPDEPEQPDQPEAKDDGSADDISSTEDTSSKDGLDTEASTDTKKTETKESDEMEELPQRAVGNLVYLDGVVDVHRDGRFLEPHMVNIGLEIESWDLMVTGKEGEAEVELSTPVNRGSRINVSPNTAFYFELEEIEDKRVKSNLEMLMGSLSLKVDKVVRGGELTVTTESSVLGVRGTEFTVTTAPERSMLVTCTEGKVECASKSGGTEYAVPGTGVEQLPDGTLKAVPVAVSDVDKFRKNWLSERIEVFESVSTTVTSYYAAKYNEYVGKFNEAYKNLLAHNSVFMKWARELEQGRESSTAQLMKEKKKVNAALFDMRKVLFLFERIYYRLAELHYYYQQGSIQEGQLKTGESVARFFTRFEKHEKTLAQKMSMVRYIFKLYSKKSGNVFPVGDFLSGEEDVQSKSIFQGEDLWQNEDIWGKDNF